MSRILVLVLAASLMTQVVAQQTPPTPTASDFIVKAAEAGMKQFELGQLASDKASTPDVKALGRRLVVDHSILNEELIKLARSKGVALTVTLRTDPTVLLKPGAASTALATVEGPAFDRAFIDQMVKDHQEAFDLFKTEADEGKDAEIKDWAEKKLPTLKEHLRLSKELQEKMSR
jgi:putative membrane protein